MNQAVSEELVLHVKPARGSWQEITFWSAIVLAATVIAVGYVYYSIFSIFQPYDDEGYILISLKSFFQGKPLYDEVYSSFQPGFYVLHWLLFKIWGAPLCHDSIRLLTLMFWLMAAVLNGLITYRLSSSSLLALFVSVVSVQCLRPFANEPGHPQALAYVLVASVVAILAFADSIPPRLLAAVIGGLAGLVLLIKINVGAYLLMPALLLFASAAKSRVALWLSTAVGVVMMGLPIILWRAQLAAKDVPLWALWLVGLFALLLVSGWLWGRGRMVLVIALAFVACTVALLGMESTSVGALPVFSAGLLLLSICGAVLMCLAQTQDPFPRNFSWMWALSACGSVLVGVTLITMLRGTTLHGLAEGFLWWPAKVSTSFLIRPRSNWLGLFLGLAGAASCYTCLTARERWGTHRWFQTSLVAGQIIFGISVLAEFYIRVPGSRTLMPVHNDLPHFWMLPFAWLVAVPETGSQQSRLGRLSLLTIAVMQPLIACPVAGTQLVPASMLIPVLAAVCLANGLRATLGFVARIHYRRWLLLAAGAGVSAVILVPFGLETLRLGRYYNSREPLNLPGATHIRLSSDEVQVYHKVIAELAHPEVETFLTLPGLDSFYLWAQKDPPNGLNVSGWLILLGPQEQERVWQAAQSHPGLMVVKNRKLIRRWVGGHSIEQLPLVRHIDDNFKPLSSYGGYELMIRR